MPERPEVSVVIPTHNRWELLSLALAGALGQENVHFEVVVVDDGSADETPARLAELDEPRLRVLRHETPQGVARARNAGIAEAAGEWVAFLDDDDIWSPRKLRAQLDAARPRDASFVYGTAVVLNERWAPVRTHFPPPPEKLDRLLLLTNPIGGPSTFMAKTVLVRDLGGFDERFSALADWDLLLGLSRSGRGAACREVVVGYVEHGENMLVVHADRVTREFHDLAAKHRAAALAEGVEFGGVWFSRWCALRHRKAGRRLRAARGYFHGAVANRSAEDVLRGVGVLFGERVMQIGQRVVDKGAPAPAWLELYR
jgi:glycosyltransferase involved in cell wall biosynthesis